MALNGPHGPVLKKTTDFEKYWDFWPEEKLFSKIFKAIFSVSTLSLSTSFFSFKIISSVPYVPRIHTVTMTTNIKYFGFWVLFISNKKHRFFTITIWDEKAEIVYHD